MTQRLDKIPDVSFYESRHGPVARVEGQDCYLPDIARFSARALVFSLSELDRKKLAQELNSANVGEVGTNYGSCSSHNPLKSGSFYQDDLSARVGRYSWALDSFLTAATHLLKGGFAGYDVTHEEVLAARNYVAKVARDETLWELLEREENNQPGRKKMALRVLGKRVEDPQILGRLNLNIFSKELQNHLTDTYLKQ